MDKLTAKEEEILNLFWEKGPLFVREIVDIYADPKPHFNTISTMVRALEDKGFLGHIPVGKSFQYYAIVNREDFGKRNLTSIIGKYFKNSYLRVVSSFVEEGNIPVEQLRELLDEIENPKKERTDHG